ncbi:MAG: MltA domain-containing protein [Alphaproteobacteria bacterium]|nr:MltA domain-containing protein [Alphaproteobacteria bacterium]NNF24198.1 murein transglycosylase [Paracoccaceae bacterium]
MRWARLIALTASMAMSAPAHSQTTHSVLDWSDLQDWTSDNHAAALDVFLKTCTDLTDDEWVKICAVAHDAKDARAFFESLFLPVLIEDDREALFTGYYEPELRGSLTPTEAFRFPIYRKPPEVKAGTKWYSRGEIEKNEILAGRGLEIAWVDNPVDAFFLQIQGSGRISLVDGGKLRVGYGGRNGHKYRSVGQELIRRGIFAPHQVSARVIRNWVGRNPDEGQALLHHNPSFIFFREVSEVPAAEGPLGAMNRSVTALRSIAVDPSVVPLGAPVWIEKDGKSPLRRLMVAQDTGSAIKGAQRADIFYGTGPDAGLAAGSVRDPGRMIVLLPIKTAYQLASGG